MKKLTFLFILFIFVSAFAQIPRDYYSSATGKGYELKTQLSNIITQGHRDQGYVWSVINACDIDRYYENDGSILDIYSENPKGKDPYTYTVRDNQCGKYNKEGDCYNREHIFPQGYFRQNFPMRGDYHHIVATDGFVNGKRDNYPFGEVDKAILVFQNGSQLGNSKFVGYSGVVFEPIDEFKGDVARMLLYFITRYESQLPNFNGGGSQLDGTINRGFEQWYINLLLKWHNQDPVSQRKIDRNNCVFSRQGNRNPYVDRPEFVNDIWTSTLSIENIKHQNASFSISPNPVKKGIINIKGLNANPSKVEIYSITGQLVQSVDKISNSEIQLNNLTKGIYILKIDHQTAKFIVE